MAQKMFRSYDLLRVSLKRAGIPNSGATATLLLECFLNNHGDLKASLVEARGLCEAGKFKIWRDELITKGWLHYSIGDYSRHSAGQKLVKYINKEKMLSSEIATTDEVFKVDSKVNKLEERVSLLEATVSDLIEELDPPVTEEKVQRRLRLVREKKSQKTI
jgi:hypothetical protein